ncbi:MAG: hypothetical protein Phyf2KO_19930 [Phycisphaerales bacterium]
MTRPTRPISIAALVIAGFSLSAHAQPIGNQDLERLTSESFEDIREARSDIMAVIDDPNLATSERLNASSQLIEPLSAMIESGDELKVVNALMIAGNIVTPEAIALIEASYESENPGVRYAALKALRSTFDILGNQRTPSIDISEINRQIQTASDILRADGDTYVAEGAARALIAAAKMRDNRLSASAELAFGQLASAASARLGSIDDVQEDKQMGVIRIAMMSNFELGRILQSGPNKPGRDAIRTAAGLAGDSLAHAFGEFEAAGRQIASISEDNAEVLAQLVGASENLVYSAQTALGQDPTRAALRGAFESGNDRNFNRAILTLIGGSGVLVQAPFSLEPDRFVASGG